MSSSMLFRRAGDRCGIFGVVAPKRPPERLVPPRGLPRCPLTRTVRRGVGGYSTSEHPLTGEREVPPSGQLSQPERKTSIRLWTSLFEFPARPPADRRVSARPGRKPCTHRTRPPHERFVNALPRPAVPAPGGSFAELVSLRALSEEEQGDTRWMVGLGLAPRRVRIPYGRSGRGHLKRRK